MAKGIGIKLKEMMINNIAHQPEKFLVMLSFIELINFLSEVTSNKPSKDIPSSA